MYLVNLIAIWTAVRPELQGYLVRTMAHHTLPMLTRLATQYVQRRRFVQ
jgi:hypothetical protein